jgi:hypothetical protein
MIDMHAGLLRTQHMVQVTGCNGCAAVCITTCCGVLCCGVLCCGVLCCGVVCCAVVCCALQESSLAQLSECQAQLAAAHQRLAAAEEELLNTHRQVRDLFQHWLCPDQHSTPQQESAGHTARSHKPQHSTAQYSRPCVR